MFTADRSGDVREWDTNGHPVGKRLRLSDGPITAMSVSSAGTRVAVARGDGKAQVFDLPSGRPVTARLDTGSGHSGVALSPDGRRLIASQTVSQTAAECGECFMLYDLAIVPLKGHPLRPPRLNSGERGVANVAAFNASGTRFATATRNGWVDLWDTATGEHLWTAGFPRGIRSLAFSPDDTRLAVGANTGLLVVLKASNGATLQQLRGHRGEIGGIAFSPDGKLLASESSQDHTLRIWRLDLGLTMGRPAWLGVDGVASLGWTDNGRKVAAPHFFAGAMLFDIDAGRLDTAACGLARRNLTSDEWRQYFGTKAYRRTCPSYPSGT